MVSIQQFWRKQTQTKENTKMIDDNNDMMTMMMRKMII